MSFFIVPQPQHMGMKDHPTIHRSFRKWIYKAAVPIPIGYFTNLYCALKNRAQISNPVIAWHNRCLVYWVTLYGFECVITKHSSGKKNHINAPRLLKVWLVKRERPPMKNFRYRYLLKIRECKNLSIYH